MVGKDVIGYPPKKPFWRTGLEKAWLASFKALDIGSPNFPTFEDFLVNGAADRTYPDALSQIEKIALQRTESSIIKESRELEEKEGIEQYKAIAKNLRQSGDEFHASAIESLIADLIAEKNKPRRAARVTPTPKPKPEPTPMPLETFIQPAPPEYLIKLCKQSPLSQTEKNRIINTVSISDIEAAIKFIKECNTLDEFDKFELEERLRQKAMGIPIPVKEGTPEVLTKPKIATMEDIISRRKRVEEKEKEKKEGGETRRDYSNIAELAVGLKPQYNKIVKMGLRDFQEETTKYMPRLNSRQLAELAQEILAVYRNKTATNILGWLALGLVDRVGHEILAGGYDWAMSRNENALDELISRARTKNPSLPTDIQIKRDVRKTMFSLM